MSSIIISGYRDNDDTFTNAASRVLLGRHHLLDVAAGAAIGVVQAAVVGGVWRTEEQTQYILSLLGSEDPWSSA